jgi:hypothetical protein
MIPLSHHLKGRRRTLGIVGAAVAVLLAIGGYVLWSGSSWSSYHTSYSDWRSDTKTAVDDVLKLPAATAKERTDKLQALTDKAAAMTSRAGSRCKPNGMVGWQESINGTYKKWRQECETAEASLGALDSQLTEVGSYLKSEHALAAALSAALAATNGKVTESSFSAVLARWKTASGAVKGLDGPSSFAPVKAKAQKTVDGVMAAWQALVKAHAAKNEVGYDAAIKAISSAYSAVDDIETASSGEFAKVATTLQERYDAAF